MHIIVLRVWDGADTKDTSSYHLTGQFSIKKRPGGNGWLCGGAILFTHTARSMIYILSMTNFYYPDRKFFILNGVQNTIPSVPQAILFLTG